MKKFFESFSTKSFRLGSYSFVLTAIVLAIVIAVNLLANALPDRITHYDISAAKIFTFTSNTKAIVTRLTEDVTINWIVQAGQEDEILGTLLDKYTKLSDHVKVVKKNPDIYPGFAAQYTSENIHNNDLIVICGDRSRLVRIMDIYMVDTSESVKGGNENVNFANISSVRCTGRVLYENSTVPARDVTFLLNGIPVKSGTSLYKTDASGNFEFRVPERTPFTIQAVKEAGGHTLGVVPSIVEKSGRTSSYNDQVMTCGNLSERKQLMLEASDIFVALPGGVGTLDEVFTVAASYTIGYHQKKVVLYNIKGFWDSVINMLDDLESKGVIRGNWRDYICIANSLEDIEALL